jgi:hypothetical protein
MQSDLAITIINNVVVLIVAGGGWLMAWRVHRAQRNQTRLEDWAKKLEADLDWRIKHEEVAAHYVAELTGVTANKAKLDIRARMKAHYDFAPQISRSVLSQRSLRRKA